MTDRNQSGVEWEDDEFLFAVEGLGDEEDQGSAAAEGGRSAPPRPPEAGRTAFFGSKKPPRSEQEDPSAREETSLAGLMGGDDHARPRGARPEAELSGHFGAAAHPLAGDEAWEGSPHEQPRSLSDSFHAAGSSGEAPGDGSDGWGFEGDAPAGMRDARTGADDETFAFVDEVGARQPARPPHHSIESPERMRAAGPRSGAAAGSRDDLLDEDFAGDDSEVVSWADSGGERGEAYAASEQEAADEHAEAEEGEALDESADALHAGAGLAASAPTKEKRRGSGTGMRRFLIAGSVLAAAALAALAVPRFLPDLQRLWEGEGQPAPKSTASARTAKATAPKPPKEVGGAAVKTPGEDPAAKTPEVAQAVVPDVVPPVPTDPTPVNPAVGAENPTVAQGEVGPPPAPVAPTEELPAIGNRPVGEIGEVSIGEIALPGEVLPESDHAPGGEETSETFDPIEDRPIPATAWADMGGPVPAGDTLLRQSKVRVLLRNGSEFDGQLRKIDDAMIELKLETGSVVFVYEDLSEIVPLEAAGARLSEYPEGFVEFRSTARIWGRIVADLPTHVTLSFGPANLNIPKRAVKTVTEQPMSTILLGPGKSS